MTRIRARPVGWPELATRALCLLVLLTCGRDPSHETAARPTRAHADPELPSPTPVRVDLDALARSPNAPPLVSKMVFNPLVGEQRSYRGYDLEALLVGALEGHPVDAGTVVLFRCADGYQPAQYLQRLPLSKGLIAVRSANPSDLWREAQGSGQQIGDSWLLWSQTGVDHSMPWPYRLREIEIGQLDLLMGAALPEGDARAHRGFEIFLERCMACHTSHLVGGTVGVELSHPIGVTRYWIRAQLERFIRNPAAFRARSRMPTFEDLSDAQIQDLLHYLDSVGGDGN